MSRLARRFVDISPRIPKKELPLWTLQSACPLVGRQISERMVTPIGFEPMTHSLEGCCSIQLSYGARSRNIFGAPPRNRTWKTVFRRHCRVSIARDIKSIQFSRSEGRIFLSSHDLILSLDRKDFTGSIHFFPFSFRVVQIASSSASLC